MSYSPKLNVIDLTQVAANVFAYIGDNQSDALEWAGTSLPRIVKFYKSAAGRLTTKFPCLMLIKKELAEDPADTPTAAVSLTFELVLSGSDGDELEAQASQYDMALRSLLINIPRTTITANSRASMRASVDSIESDYDVLKAGVSSAFIQVLQIRVVYKLIGQLAEN